MAECLDCLDNLSVDDILKLVTTCDEDGNVSWNLYEVTDTESCHSCAQYESLVDYLRKSLYCDENGKYYIRVTLA